MKQFNYVSLFSGIGGFETALNRLGGRCVMASEIDKFANKAYGVLYGHPTAGDVKQIAAEDVPDHTFLVGGFPCQAFSTAGRRRGFEDARGTLFYEVARIAKVKQPRAMLLENVKGLVNHDGGKTLEVIISVLCEVGYTVDFAVVNSKFYGVPQNRERIMIVAVRNDLVEPEPWQITGNSVVAKAKRRIQDAEGVRSFNFQYPEQGHVAKRLVDVLQGEVDEKFYIDKKVAASFVESPADAEFDGTSIRRAGSVEAIKGNDYNRRVYDTKGIAPTLSTMGGGNVKPKIVDQATGCVVRGDAYRGQPGRVEVRTDDVSTTLMASSRATILEAKLADIVEPEVDEKYYFSEDGLAWFNRHSEKRESQGYGGRFVPETDLEGVAKCLSVKYGWHVGDTYLDMDAITGCSLRTRSYCGQGQQLEIRGDQQSNTVTTVPKDALVLEAKRIPRIRRLTPLECFRLQGFPDEYCDKLRAAGISDTQLYKMAGNAVTVNVIQAVAERIVADWL